MYDELRYDSFIYIKHTDPNIKMHLIICKYATSMTVQSLHKQLKNM